MHEAQLHGTETCFVTLTYDDDHLPPNGLLVPRDLQLFFKRLRKRIAPGAVRFLACGEYGETTQRPHYHALLFGWRPPDMVKFRERRGTVTYTSEILADLWGNGHCTVGNVSLESASYVSQYVLKKQKGKTETEVIDKETGEVFSQSPFLRMSRNPGLGARWFERFSGDVYPRDEVILNGRHFKVPRYYDSKLEAINPDVFQDVKAARKERAKENPNFDDARRAAKKRIAEKRLAERKKRNADYDKVV